MPWISEFHHLSNIFINMKNTSKQRNTRCTFDLTWNFSNWLFSKKHIFFLKWHVQNRNPHSKTAWNLRGLWIKRIMLPVCIYSFKHVYAIYFRMIYIFRWQWYWKFMDSMTLLNFNGADIFLSVCISMRIYQYILAFPLR